jgi:hypothetical protein
MSCVLLLWLLFSCHWTKTATAFTSHLELAENLSGTDPETGCESESESYVTTDAQSASLSWNKAPIWGLRPDIYYFLTITFLLLLSSLSDEMTGVFCTCYWPSPAQCFLGPSPFVLVTIFYCLIFETSLFVASYDSQGHGGGIRPRLHTGLAANISRVALHSLRTNPHRKLPLYCWNVFTNHCIATVAVLTAANSLLCALPSNEQQTLFYDTILLFRAFRGFCGLTVLALGKYVTVL